ncbi:polysaccharide biosynthesis/export family protein [Pontibacter cellulosilyticus]|uniref:Polysaccharide biosynthesis/export family protein n=1 Tax=Pontibacter cellulosilyticus TaxID=1720253 RepID=A0A923N7Z3_9BACT|nr:polysaccharide biosynthesis/export family protein [Pontibacter cellulosilyticus]MBC5992537.1 polysaccharide biosynthesis/export family protein [Pontibacter cellulosilyticus]
MRVKFFYLIAFLFFVSCTPRNLAYFNDLQEQTEYSENIQNNNIPKIQPDDLLSITVTSLSPEANAIFNRGEVMQTASISNFSIASNVTTNNLYREGYLVDEEGFINFPVLGKVKVSGLTRVQATEKIASDLKQHIKDPIINVRYLNFKVTVVGEVNRPSTFTIPTQKINILEALGMAGDMTAFGKRENVLVIREEGGVRKMTRLNLNNKEVLSSPYFYLQQNDVVYVEPDRMKEVQASANTRTLSIVAAAASIVSIFVARLF